MTTYIMIIVSMTSHDRPWNYTECLTALRVVTVQLYVALSY